MEAGATLRTEWMAAPILALGGVGQEVDSSRPRRGVAVAEPFLSVVEHGIIRHPRLQVAGVEQRDADAGRRRRLEQHLPHLVRLRVAGATAVVVQVVELADAGVPGQHHLGERRRSEGTVRIGIESIGERVHPLAPRPERTGFAMGASAQCPMKGVAVRVGDAWQRQPGKNGGRRVGGATPTVTAAIRSRSTVMTTPCSTWPSRAPSQASSHQ